MCSGVGVGGWGGVGHVNVPCTCSMHLMLRCWGGGVGHFYVAGLIDAALHVWFED